MGGKFRWQIIHIKEKIKSDDPVATERTGSQDNLTTDDAGNVNYSNRTYMCCNSNVLLS